MQTMLFALDRVEILTLILLNCEIHLDTFSLEWNIKVDAFSFNNV